MRTTRKELRVWASVLVTSVVAATMSMGSGAGAAGVAHAAPGAHVTGIHRVSAQILQVDVYSPTMDRVIPNTVLRPRGGGTAPTLYLLNGVKGGVDGVSWLNNSDYENFFADRNVNVVTPIGGPASNYTNWHFDDPVLGPARANQWQTYLTLELPAVIDAEFRTTGRNAIAGLSMSAGPALDLAIQAPWLYDAVGAYSGCPMNSGLLGTAQVSSVVVSASGNAFNMWGPPGDPQWAGHDPFLRASELHGTAVYLSGASGIPGPIDDVAPSDIPRVAAGGGVVEAVANACTVAFSQRLRAVGVPHTYNFRDRGAHTWPLFESDLRHSWHTTLGPALTG